MKSPMVEFFVAGEPRAKQSFRATRGGGYQPARVKAWQNDCGWAGQQAMRALGRIDPIESGLTVELIFFLGNARRIDLDNLSKCVQDGLNGVVWKDDQQNITLWLSKYVCRTKTGVLVRVFENNRPVVISEPEMDVFFVERRALLQVIEQVPA
jgi:Holliday junction resolvase RusA-like endonuclease